jgi:RND superfamily putative drug exporter
MFDWLIRLALGRARAVLIGAVLLFVVAGAFGGSVADRLPAGDAFVDPGSDSVKASTRFEEVANMRAAPGVLILVQTPTGARSVEGLRRVRAITRRAAKDQDVARVLDLRDGDKAAKKAADEGHPGSTGTFVSKDGKQTYIAVFAKPDTEESLIGKRLTQAFSEDVRAGTVEVGGPGPAGQAIGDQVVADLGTAEQIAFPLLLILMLFVFRGVVAALLPLAVGGLTIVCTLSLLRIVNDSIPLSIFALNLAVALGLGLAIDYSLFMVSRFREELDRGLDPKEAMVQTLHTAGRTVFFSSLTVSAALVSLGVFPQQFLYSMAISGGITALLASATALIALPAVLVTLGPRINALAPKRLQHKTQPERTGFWFHLSRWVMKRAVLVTVVAGGLLLLIGSPFLHIKFTGIDASVLPDGIPAKHIDSVLRKDFSAAGTEPISVVVSSLPDDTKGTAAMDKYVDAIAKLPNVKNVARPTALPPTQTWQFDVNAIKPALDPATIKLIRDIRAVHQPGPALVAGQTARYVDQQAALAHGLPMSLGIISFATLTILFLMTGSVLLPIKSLIMNILAISAAFGVLVFIFQEGHFEKLLQYQSQGGLESTQPMLLLALAFGLSTDYGVFLLTRIKEGRDDGMSNEDAVAVGIQRTGKIITAAALLFVVTIGAFATSKIIFIKEVGVGTAAAVLIDATIVRALLVPALMRLLGEWNWWAPKPLRRLHDSLGISETAPEIVEEREVVPAAPVEPGKLAPTTPLSRLEVPSKRNDGQDPAPRPL